jgi:hypothetical protein
MMLILSENHELTIDFKSRTTRTWQASIFSSSIARCCPIISRSNTASKPQRGPSWIDTTSPGEK